MQSRLARLLGLSQNRLSEIERGEGSFTAEQLIVLLKTFNLLRLKLAEAGFERRLGWVLVYTQSAYGRARFS